MKFKLFSALVALWVFGPGITQAAEGLPGKPDDFMPFRTTTVSVPEEKSVVRMFFSFSCPFCFQSHGALLRWGTTLPKSLRFEATPVVTRDPGAAIGAAYYFAVKQVAPARLEQFVVAAYEEIQRAGGRPDKEETYLRAARRAGLAGDILQRAVRTERIADAAYQAGVLLANYKIDGTPAIVVGGKYIVTPETTQGVNGNFYQLANAVTSKMLIEGGRGN